MRLLDTIIQHLDDHGHIVREVNHQLLVLLHGPEAMFVDAMGVVEEQIVLTGQFDPAVLRALLLPESENFAPDRFQGADLLGADLGVLDPELEWHLAVVHDPVAFSQ
eukprot:CAMPEP_0115243412 /NCGR_PEP_ID=MMETSP0270-20121206/39458_1 /TAXON_ID=71861 /ORGANISM="Scrippsiella trochoidea, Strain CCMP3099" /LENGTH=106 /DNA_ID=CAMNT_0002658515 /DNA_START=285 /DNA_END=605 /DNA_ORIENTATION=-